MNTRIAIAPDHGQPVPATERRPMTTKRKLEAMVAHTRCFLCGEKLTTLEDTEFDHILPLELSGADEPHNIAPVHSACHRHKTKTDVKAIAKSKRIRRRLAGQERPKRKIPSRPFEKRRKPVETNRD